MIPKLILALIKMSSLNEEREAQLLESKVGVVLKSSDEKEVFLSRKDALRSRVLEAVLLGSEAVENRSGWSSQKYKSEPLLQIEIPIPFPYYDIKIIADLLTSENVEVISNYNLDEKQLVELLNVVIWFDIKSSNNLNLDNEDLSKSICSQLVKPYTQLSTRELLESFKFKTVLESKADPPKTKFLDNLVGSKTCYVLFDNDYFIATDAYFDRKEDLISAASNMILYGVFHRLNLNSTDRVKHIISLNEYRVAYAEIKVLPYTYIYGHFDQVKMFDISSEQKSEVELKDNISLNVAAIKYIQYNTSSSLPNLHQRLFISKLLEYPKFATDYIPICLDYQPICEYKCIPVKKIPVNISQDFHYLEEFMKDDLNPYVFKSYAIVTAVPEDRNGAYDPRDLYFINTKYPYNFYSMEQIESGVDDLIPIDSTRFLLINSPRRTVSLYDIKKLVENKPFVPIYTLGEENEVGWFLGLYLRKKNESLPLILTGEEKDSSITIYHEEIKQSISGYTFYIDGSIYSIEGNKIGSIYFPIYKKDGDDDTRSDHFSSVGDFIISIGVELPKGVNQSDEEGEITPNDKWSIKIVRKRTIQVAYDKKVITSPNIMEFVGNPSFLSATVPNIIECVDNPNILAVSYPLDEKTSQIDVIFEDNKIKSFQYVRANINLNRSRMINGKISQLVEPSDEIKEDLYHNDNPIATTIKKFSTDYKWSIIMDLHLDYEKLLPDPIIALKEKRDHEWKVVEMEAKILKCFERSGYEVKRIKIDEQFSKHMPERNIIIIQNESWRYTTRIIGNNDAIFRLVRPRGTFGYASIHKMLAFKYVSKNDTLINLGCQCGKIIEIPLSEKLIVESGYSGSVEIWE